MRKLVRAAAWEPDDARDGSAADVDAKIGAGGARGAGATAGAGAGGCCALAAACSVAADAEEFERTGIAGTGCAGGSGGTMPTGRRPPPGSSRSQAGSAVSPPAAAS
jgi:hypothetical protein